jgi:ribosomal protein S2
MAKEVYIADMRVEKTAVTEAHKTSVPVVGVCDTNVDPSKATCVIPANDDAINSIKMMADIMVEAVKEGRAEWEKKNPEIAQMRNSAAQTNPFVAMGKGFNDMFTGIGGSIGGEKGRATAQSMVDP